MGVAYGAMDGLLHGLANNKSAKDVLIDTAIGGAVGGASAYVLGGLAKLAGNAVVKLETTSTGKIVGNGISNLGNSAVGKYTLGAINKINSNFIGKNILESTVETLISTTSTLVKGDKITTGKVVTNFVSNLVTNTAFNSITPLFSATGAGEYVDKSDIDFYVKPDGTVVPATGYRYMDTKYAEQTIKSNKAPGSYISFDKFESSIEAQNALQISSEWSDAGLRGEFDTLQIINNIRIPYEYGDTGDILEPLTKSYPEYGTGGYRQAVTDMWIEFKTNGLKFIDK